MPPGEPRRWRRLGYLLLAAGLASQIAGCGSSTSVEPPSPSRSLAATPPAPPTDAAGAAALPAKSRDMQRFDERGAAAAASYFLAVAAYAYQSGDVKEWDRISSQDCKFCTGIRDDVIRAYSDGGRYSGGRLTTHSVVVLGQDPVVGVFAVSVPYSLEQMEQFDASGRRTDSIAKGKGRLRIEVLDSVHGWVLIGARADQTPRPRAHPYLSPEAV